VVRALRVNFEIKKLQKKLQIKRDKKIENSKNQNNL
jgi:hypothetical protein